MWETGVCTIDQSPQANGGLEIRPAVLFAHRRAAFACVLAKLVDDTEGGISATPSDYAGSVPVLGFAQAIPGAIEEGLDV